MSEINHANFVYLCGECFDCAIVFDEKQRSDRGIDCPVCENTIWFDEATPDIRNGVEGEDWSIDEYGVSEVFEKYGTLSDPDTLKSILAEMSDKEVKSLHEAVFDE